MTGQSGTNFSGRFLRPMLKCVIIFRQVKGGMVMKRWLSVLLALCMIWTVLAPATLAEDVPDTEEAEVIDTANGETAEEAEAIETAEAVFMESAVEENAEEIEAIEDTAKTSIESSANMRIETTFAEETQDETIECEYADDHASAELMAAYIRPVTPWNVTRTFASHSNQGLDIGVSIGTAVYAVAEGTVVTALDRGCQGSHRSDANAQNRCPSGSNCPAYKANPGSNGSYANYIVINHGNNLYSLYAHLQTGSFQVSEGSHVQQGQLLAKSGTAGNATGPHLHLEFRLNNSYSNQVNPEDYMSGENPNHSPTAVFDGAESTSPGKLHVWGWAFDPDDTGAALSIHVYLGSETDVGTCYANITADKNRPDVDNVHHCGAYHGFDDTIDIPQNGTYTVRAAALDATDGGAKAIF